MHNRMCTCWCAYRHKGAWSHKASKWGEKERDLANKFLMCSKPDNLDTMPAEDEAHKVGKSAWVQETRFCMQTIKASFQLSRTHLIICTLEFIFPDIFLPCIFQNTWNKSVWCTFQIVPDIFVHSMIQIVQYERICRAWFRIHLDRLSCTSGHIDLVQVRRSYRIARLQARHLASFTSRIISAQEQEQHPQHCDSSTIFLSSSSTRGLGLTLRWLSLAMSEATRTGKFHLSAPYRSGLGDELRCLSLATLIRKLIYVFLTALFVCATCALKRLSANPPQLNDQKCLCSAVLGITRTWSTIY